MEMNPGTIEVLEKTRIAKANQAEICCGGAPVSNGDACCRLDEEKKAEGQNGCGCQSDNPRGASGCC